MGQPKLRPVGDIEATDLRILFEACGAEFLPYPIAQYGARSMGSAEHYARHAAAVLAAFRDGELSKLAPPLDLVLSNPDLRVEYYAHDLERDKPIHRVAAFRRGDHACLLRQVGVDDRVEINTLSPFDIGAAIADMTPALRQGRHPAVIVDGYTSIAEATSASTDITQRVSGVGNLPRFGTSDLSAFGSVQSSWRPARQWGRDPDKELIRWVYTGGDSYLVERDGSWARPVGLDMLRNRIDEGIAVDVAAIRANRSP